MSSPRVVAVVLLAGLLGACSGGSGATPRAAASSDAATAPVPGVTLPPDALAPLVPRPDEVPAGMVPVLAGSGPRDLQVVASYSGKGPAQQAAAASLTAHGFLRAYVAQYAHPTNGQVLSVLVSSFRSVAGATADLGADLAAPGGTAVPEPTLGDQSAVTTRTVPGSAPAQLVVVRFRRGATTWSLAYQAAPTADPAVAVALARRLLDRTAA